MTKYLIILILFALSFGSYSQVNLTRISNEFCECFDEANKKKSNENHELILKKCIDQKKADYENDLNKLLDSPENQIEFIKVLGSNCVAFIEYYTRNLNMEQDLSDEEYTENIYLILDYFSSASEKGKLPKSVSLSFSEVGILYNIYLNKVYPDSIYREGFHIIQPHDSIIVFDIGHQNEIIEMEILLKDNSNIAIEEVIWFSPKSDSIGQLYKTIGYSYIKRYVIPIVRQATRSVFSSFTSKELYRLNIDELSNIVLDSIQKKIGKYDFINFYQLKIHKIEYPHIIEKAISENLIDSYDLLKSDNTEKRKEALVKLFDNGSETAYLIILTHWSNEKDQEILDYILKRLIER